MMLFDTHTHIYLSKEKTEQEIVQDIIHDSELSYITSIWIDIPSSLHNLELHHQFPFILPTVWIHPCYVQDYIWKIDETIHELETMILWGNIVAIWEIWLDYYRLPPRLTNCHPELDSGSLKDLQKQFFISQISLAQKYNLPIIIHNREAKEDVLEILKQTNCKNFVFHCYSENLEFAKKVLEFAPNSYISFSGIVTFNSARELQETASAIPLKNILIETDCPYLSPAPHRGEENHPHKVKFVLQKIQDLRTESPQEIEDIIYQNSLSFFHIQ